MCSNRKKILILGAGDAQLSLIRVSQKQGYYVIVCDVREEMKGEKIADKYYKINYLDQNAVLEIAKREKIDGVISNSEPAMLNVAYIAGQLGLPGNSMESVEVLLSKQKFRDLQKKAGVFVPEYHVASSVEELLACTEKMKYPIVIKPTESSGTRGTTKLCSFQEDEIRKAFESCSEFSRNCLVTVEEYVEMSCLTVNGADIFVIGDEIMWDGWFRQNRSKDMPMLPMTEVFPLVVSEDKKTEIQRVVNKIIHASGVSLGEYNVETYYTKDDDVFVIEINPRQAGNHIPQLIEEHSGVSLTRLLVSTAVGDMSYYEYLKTFKRESNYVTQQVVFSKKGGIFERLYIAPEIEDYVNWCDIVVREGDVVAQGINAAEAVAYVDLHFDSYDTQHYYTDKIEEYIYPILRG